MRCALLLLAACACGSPAPKQEAPPASEPRDPTAAEREKRDAAMNDVMRAYDKGDYELARTGALVLLIDDPTNVRMLRIVVSASCMLGDGVEAKLHYERLPAHDRTQMEQRCARFGITFSDVR